MTSAGYGDQTPQAYTLNGTGFPVDVGGGVMVGQGALRFTEDTTTSRPITLATDSDIAVDASRTGTLTGAIDGAGNLRKIGLGTLIIAGSPKTYGGTIDVAAGKLKVLTPITSPVVVRAGAILEGPPIYFPGGVAGVTVEPGGTWNYGPNAWWGNGDPTAGGNWSDPDNWTHMVVPGVGATVGEDATIGSTTVKRTITVDVPVTIGTLEWHQIDGANLNYIVLEQDLTCVTALLPGNISGPYSWHNATHPMTVSEGTSFSQVDGDHIDFYGIVFSGTGSVVKNGTTTWGLRQYGVTQPFAGTWIVNDGILLFGRGGSCQNSARVIVKAGGSMMSAGYGDQTPQAYTLNGTGHQDQGALRFTASDASSRPITVETDALLTVDSGFTATVTGAIDGDGILTKGGLGKLAISACTTDVSVAAGTLGLETSTALAETSSLSIATGATIDVADDANVVVAALYIDDVLQFSGTYGPTGSGAANINDTLFTGRLGMITAGSPGPAITAFVVSDASTGSTLVTNDATVNVTLTAEAGGASITGYAITQEDVQPTEGWSETAPTTCTITGGEGTITLYAWVKDSADVVGKASASILFTTAVPVVTNVAVAGPEGTATVTWDTDIDTVGSVKYGQVSQTGGTTAEVAETALGKAHSVTITGLEAGKNYKLVIVNNEILASPPVYWPSPWPIAGDANHDCRVNILDLIFIRNKLNQAVGTGDNWKADVNEDTRINILDLIFVRNKLNTQCP